MEHEELFPLLCSVAEGDKRAFSQLYEVTSAQIYAVALKILQEQALAEEATQDAYVKIWHGASSYSPDKGTVLTWMVSIVRYRSLDIIRYQGVRKAPPLSESFDLSQETSNAYSSSTHERLSICMDELEMMHKQAIRLAYFGGLSHREVEAHMGKSLGTIKSWIRRGLQSLQRCLGI